MRKKGRQTEGEEEEELKPLATLTVHLKGAQDFGCECVCVCVYCALRAKRINLL